MDFDISSDDDILDEIVIAPLKTTDLLNPLSSSPIHFCDNSVQSDDNSTNISVNSTHVTPVDETVHTNQLTTESCTSKNSKSRRMEYSMRGMKMCNSNNPSQDSAFGSMTDGELSIASSSLRMSSFQSISSPIDEGVEDSITGISGPLPLSRTSTPSNEIESSTQCNIAQSTSDMSLSRKKMPSLNSSNAITMEPPTILVNDKNSVYTTSPARAFSTIEVFSQKYRVSSFEDMSNQRTSLKNVQKQNFRSLEEEQRIDSAFTPIGKPVQSHHRSFDANRSSINNTEKFKKLTHVAFARKICSTKERHLMWKNSILNRKDNLIKSNESLHEFYGTMGSSHTLQKTNHFQETPPLCKRVNSINELSSSHRSDIDQLSSSMCEELKTQPRKSLSERYLLNLGKLRQSNINDYEECDEDEVNAIHRAEVENFIDETSSSSGTSNNKVEAASGSTDSSPSHRSMCKIIGGIETDTRCTEEKIPLLDGMEMSPISPTETDEML